MNRRLVNTEQFKPAAKKFLEDGYYCDAPPKTKDYYDFWLEEQRRCNEGYSVGGQRITGSHYFYLNYCQMLLVPKDEKGKRGKVQKIQTFPRFWDYDYDFFWTLDIAQNGIDGETEEERQKKLDDLDLVVDIQDLDGGFHLAVLKSRGKGFSYKCGSMLAKNYAMGDHSKNFALAEEKEYLISDGLLNKTYDNVAFVDMHTPWQQPRLVDKMMHKKAGYKKKTERGYVEKGRKNEIIGVTLKNNPDAARGKRGDLLFFEEAGKCKSLLKAWEIARQSLEQGAITTGTMIAFGTGGSNEEAQAGMEELFNNPISNNCVPINNQWDEGADGTNCCFFVPAYMNFAPFMDEDGNSDIEGAKQAIEEEREKKSNSPNPRVLGQYVCEVPFTPQEALTQESTNLLPTQDIQAHLNAVNREKKWNKLMNCMLYRDGDGVIQPKVGRDVPPPVMKFPAPKESDTRGCVQILEHPVKMNGGTPNNLYIIVHDPYAKDRVKSGKGSLGSAYVIKLWNNFSMSYMGCPVASYVGRPDTMDEYNRNLFLLAEYYNAKICFESNRGSVVSYAKRKKMIEYLAPTPTIIEEKVRARRTTSSISYGLNMAPAIKDTGELYLRDWLNTEVETLESGEKIKILHKIFDPALLQEMIRYNKDGNFDRVMSLLVGQFFIKQKEQENTVPSANERLKEDFFNKELFV